MFLVESKYQISHLSFCINMYKYIYIYMCVSVVNACNSYCGITLRKVFFNILVIFLKFLSSFVIR